jgi:putative membrane protein
MEKRSDSLPKVLLIIVAGVLAWSMVRPADWFTWVLEVMPVLIAAPILIFTYRRFRLTSLVYVLICIQAIILIVGGHYTYAEVPLFNWIRDSFGQARNNFDKLGHFAQGFVPAMIAREVLLRTSPLVRGKWLAFIVVSIALAISAAYELIEWSVAAATGSAADAFLGTQGDPWDTQKDMAWALIGAVSALLFLPRLHDRQMEQICSSRKETPCS